MMRLDLVGLYNKLQDRAKEINGISFFKNKSIIPYLKREIVNNFLNNLIFFRLFIARDVFKNFNIKITYN
jgi:hypothetical protein